MAVIGTNPSALSAAFANTNAVSDVNKIVRRLASSSRLANPEDDAAGVAVSAKMDAIVRRSSAASEGVQNLMSFAQTSDSYLGVAQAEITRLGELAIRANDGTLSDADRANVNAEFVKIRDALNSQVSNASFNGNKVFDTSQTIGSVVSEDGSTTYNLTLADAAGDISGISNIDISTPELAREAIGKVDTALQNIASSRATVNADVASLNQYNRNLQIGKVNTEAANSRIRDTDYATESTNLARTAILNQTSLAMLAHANLQPKTVMSLLG